MLTAQHLSGVWAGLSLKMHVSDVSQGSTLGKGCLEELLTIYLEDVSLAIQGCQRRNNGRREHKHDEFQAAVKNPLRPPESVAIWVTRPLSLAVLPLTVLPLTVLPSRCSSLSPFFPLAALPLLPQLSRVIYDGSNVADRRTQAFHRKPRPFVHQAFG